jgi:hypothetical protein
MEWEKTHDCIAKFKEWILSFDGGPEALASAEELDQLAEQAKEEVKASKNKAWALFTEDIKQDSLSLEGILSGLIQDGTLSNSYQAELDALIKNREPQRKDVYSLARRTLRSLRGAESTNKTVLSQWLNKKKEESHDRYSSYLYSESNKQIGNIPSIEPTYDTDAPMEDGRIILRENYRMLLEKYHSEIVKLLERLFQKRKRRPLRNMKLCS